MQFHEEIRSAVINLLPELHLVTPYESLLSLQQQLLLSALYLMAIPEREDTGHLIKNVPVGPPYTGYTCCGAVVGANVQP